MRQQPYLNDSFNHIIGEIEKVYACLSANNQTVEARLFAYALAQFEELKTVIRCRRDSHAPPICEVSSRTPCHVCAPRKTYGRCRAKRRLRARSTVTTTTPVRRSERRRTEESRSLRVVRGLLIGVFPTVAAISA